MLDDEPRLASPRRSIRVSRDDGPGGVGHQVARLAEFVPAEAEWVHSATLDTKVTGGTYTGTFFLSATGLVRFDTINAT